MTFYMITRVFKADDKMHFTIRFQQFLKTLTKMLYVMDVATSIVFYCTTR